MIMVVNQNGFALHYICILYLELVQSSLPHCTTYIFTGSGAVAAVDLLYDFLFFNVMSN